MKTLFLILPSHSHSPSLSFPSLSFPLLFSLSFLFISFFFFFWLIFFSSLRGDSRSYDDDDGTVDTIRLIYAMCFLLLLLLLLFLFLLKSPSLSPYLPSPGWYLCSNRWSFIVWNTNVTVLSQNRRWYNFVDYIDYNFDFVTWKETCFLIEICVTTISYRTIYDSCFLVDYRIAPGNRQPIVRLRCTSYVDEI